MCGVGALGEVLRLHDCISCRRQLEMCACLPALVQTQRDRIRSQRCRQEVHRQMQRESEDIRFDHTLARACFKCVCAFVCACVRLPCQPLPLGWPAACPSACGTCCCQQ